VTTARAQTAADPPFEVPVADLAAALECPHPFTHPEHEPVLLVHGTFTNGHENFSWNWELALPSRGYDYCLVTYPDRGTGDMQISAEYVAYAVQEMHRRTGSKVDIVGHSQGGLMPRWAIKWWPSVQAAVDDYVMLAGPNHGVMLAANSEQSPFPIVPVGYQFAPESKFITALNADDESPGAVDYSSLYSLTDELVQPVAPVPTAGLEWGRTVPNVRNVSLQDVCPGRLVDHLSIGTTDRLTQELTIDALSHAGPVDPARVPVVPTCVLPDQYAVPEQFPVLLEQFQRSFAGGFPEYGLTDTEPPLNANAVQGASTSAPATATPTPAPGTDTTRAAAALAATGGTFPAAVGLALVALALVSRRLVR
jgi:pimeloyl-ACP methyl ester carboxylesterase